MNIETQNLVEKKYLINIVRNLNFLVRQLNINIRNRDFICSILNRLSPFIKYSDFEFSIRINRGRIDDVIRLVNFDNYSISITSLYLKRIELLKNIFFHYLKDEKVIKLFQKITEIKGLNLPIYFGLEVKNPEKIFKVYLNFSHIKDLSARQTISKNLLNCLSCNPKFKKREFPLIGFDFEQRQGIKYKIYYLYDKVKERRYLGKYRFSKCEVAIFNFLNNFNKNDYFVIAERYSNNECLSKKIEVGIKIAINQDEFIKGLLGINNFYSVGQKILDIIRVTQGQINVVIIEKQWLTIYIRVPRIENA